MKKLITVFAFLLYANLASSQITLNASDMPWQQSFNFMNLNLAGMANPMSGSNQSWNYGNAVALGSPFQILYPAETDTFFTNLGVETFLLVSKPFGNSIVTWEYFEEWDFNSTGLYVKGYAAPAGSIDLSPFGGLTTDSIGSGELKFVSSNPVAFFKYPMTMGSSWSTVSTNQFNNWISIAALGLNYAPMALKFTTFRKDSIIGWGKLTCYTTSGPSIPYDVLMRKTMGYQQDSLLVNGSPDSIQVNNLFSFTQGSKNSYLNQIDFYRAGNFRPLIRFAYGDDTTFTAPVNIIQNMDNLTPLGIGNYEKMLYSTFTYPNPSNNGQYNIQVIGKDIDQENYILTDISGRIIQGGIAHFNQNVFQLNLNSSIADGNYILSMINDKGQLIITEKLMLKR